MSKVIVRGNNLAVVSDKGFIFHSLVSQKNDCVLFSKESDSKQNGDQSDKTKDKDVKINFVCCALSSDNKLLAVQSFEKILYVYGTENRNIIYERKLVRGASKIIFMPGDKKVLVGDKTGDVYLYDIYSDAKETLLLGHLSMVLDIAMTDDSKYVITCDRDEKIRVSNYPNCYNIENYCLGHQQFVTNIQLLPHDKSLLISCSGDGTLRLWDYLHGSVKHVHKFTNDELEPAGSEQPGHQSEQKNMQLKCFTSTQLNENTSIVCVSIFKSNKIYVLLVKSEHFEFLHAINLEFEPVHLQLSFLNSSKEDSEDTINLWLLGDSKLVAYAWDSTENKFHEAGNNSIRDDLNVLNDALAKFASTFSDISKSTESVISVLQKRKMDEVNDYYERKQARIVEKGTKKKKRGRQ